MPTKSMIRTNRTIAIPFWSIEIIFINTYITDCLPFVTFKNKLEIFKNKLENGSSNLHETVSSYLKRKLEN
ncbi:MAG: hypothetical protein ACFFDF_01775 [Candidatus Odinarchaeota archaeon]